MAMGVVEELLGSDQASWVFDHNITWEDDIWKADPLDVEQVHEAARTKFISVLNSLSSGNGAVQTRMLMFHGQSGAGKTHLVRALRSYCHGSKAGYFGYAQMTPDVGNYADYYLRRLVNSLEKPHCSAQASENSLLRLSNALASDAELVPAADLENLREAPLEADDLARLIIDMADGVVSSPRFADQDLDINIVRALLYLQRNDPRIDQRVRQYLYGRQLNELSVSSVAALDPNDGQDRAFEIIESLGRVMWTTERAALVFCIDQVEDLRFFDNAEERFQKAIRDLIQIANRVPSSIILISCLDDFYFQMRDYLPQSFVDRIEKAGPILLRESRTAAEARQIIEKRIAYVLEKAGEASENINESSLLDEGFCNELAGLSTRRLLEAVETRRKELFGGGLDKESAASAIAQVSQEVVNGVQQRWERFMLDHQAEVPAEEEALITILSEALTLSRREDSKLEVTMSAIVGLEKLSAIDLSAGRENNPAVETRLFICNKRSQGGSLKRQIDKVIASTAGKNSIILRTSEFPPNQKSVTGKLLLSFMSEGGQCLVVPIYEWERMMTLHAFFLSRQLDDGFDSWMRSAQILHDLPSLRRLVRLESFESNATHVKEPVSPRAAPKPLRPPVEAAKSETSQVEMRDPSAKANRAMLPPVELGPSLEEQVAEKLANRKREAPKRSGLTARIANWIMPPPPPASAAEAASGESVAPEPAPRLDNVHHLDFSGAGRGGAAAAGGGDETSEAFSDILPMGALQSEDASTARFNRDDRQSDVAPTPSRPGDDRPAGEAASSVGEEQSAEPLLSAWPPQTANEIRAGRVLGTADQKVAFPISVFKRHVAVLGGSGSGKTTLALNLIEQLLLHDIPVVLIDRKGDLCSYANPDVWPPSEGENSEIARLRDNLRDKIDVAVYTPGRVTGRPISITLLPNGIVDLPAHELLQLANVSAAALSDMLHLGNSATHQKQCGILTVGLRQLGAMATREVTLADLIALLEDDYDDLVDETQRMDPSGKLRRDLIAQLDSLRHRNWALFEGGGEPLLMDSLLGLGTYAKPNKTRLSIIYTGFLGDNANILFWVSQFLSEALRFSQRNPNEDLQAVIMFDEADLYIPANSKPATKQPLESLLKRARSAGIGLMLATQSPGDLDYKSRDQITSWFIGKVREDTALRKLKAAFASETGIDPATALPNQKVGEFHLIQEGIVQPMKADLSLIIAEQVPFDRIEELAAGTITTKRKKKNQLLFDFG